MKQGVDRTRPSRTAIPQYLRANGAPHHHPYHPHLLQQQHQAPFLLHHQPHNHHHPHQQQTQLEVQQRPDHGYSSPGGRGRGVGGEVVAVGHRVAGIQDGVHVTPYATGLCVPPHPSPHPHPTSTLHTPDPPPKHPHRKPEGRRAAHRQPDRDRYHHPYHHHHYHPHQPNRPASVTTSGEESNLYSVPSASTPSAGPTGPPQPENVEEMEYPIRGTMSPLTCNVGGDGREDEGGGGRDGSGELSFVFGRPVTSDAAVVGRDFPPPNSLPLPKRPLSPTSRERRTGGVVEREVLSPPPVSSWWSEAGEGVVAGGVCCEQCHGCLVELKRQALRLMFPDNNSGTWLPQTVRVEGLEERLEVPDSLLPRYTSGSCQVCGTPVAQLKQEATAMIRSIQLAQSAATAITNTSLPALVGSCTPQHRYGKKGQTYSRAGHASLPLAAQAQAYLEHNVRAWMNPGKAQVLTSRSSTSSTDGTSNLPDQAPHPSLHHQNPTSPGTSHPQGRPPPGGTVYLTSSGLSTCSVPPCPSAGGQGVRGASPAPSSCASSPPPNSAAVSFFHRAAQKLSKKKRRQQSQEQDLPAYPTCYGRVVRLTPPPAPPCLLRTVGRLHNPGVGKVKVMLRVTSPPGCQGDTGSRFLSVDPHRKQITIFDPSASGYVTSANRRTGIAAPKMFGFDAVFSPDDSLTELCAASLSEMVQAVVSGADGCLFTYGYSRTGKSHSMLGTDQSAGTLGVMPCAIAWLFKLINEQKDKTGARFSVRVSAVEVTGKNENLRDLLADIAQGTEATGVGTAPGVYLREDPICGTQLENQSELRAPTADKAALYLDAALATRCATDEDEARCSHLLFTLNVYQYRIEKANRAGLPGVAGGRSRLHLIDLGSASKSRDPSNVSLSLSALGNVIMALLNGQRHVPHRDSKISQLLRDSLGNVTCRTCMLAHVSSAVPHYNETLQVIQLAARIHRMKRRRTKFSSTSSEDSSTDESGKFRRPYRGLRMGTLREDVLYSSSHSDPDYTSSSEQSCDTVIYLGAAGQSLSDRELTDHEGPPRHVPRTNPRLPRRPSGSRSSGDDSDSGRSRASDGRYGPRPAMGTRAGTPVQVGSPARVPQPVPHVISAPGSPTTGQAKMAHRFTLQGKEAAAKGGGWPDKMSKHRAKPLDTAGEQWVDGPGAAIYPESKKSGEQWVDGPPAFLVQNEAAQQSAVAPHSPSHRGDTARRLKNRKVEAEEQWVDGPREMMATSTGTSTATPLHTASPMHTSSKAEPCVRAVVGQPNQAPKLSTAVNDKALKQALIRHLEKERPDSAASLESHTSTTVEAASSRPASMTVGGGGEGKEGAVPHCLDCAPAPHWDRRQAGDGVSVVDVQTVEGADSAYSTSASPHRKHHHSGQRVHGALASSCKQLAQPSPRGCRKAEVEGNTATARLQKSDLPGSASPTHRVVQWIKSVSSSDAGGSDTEQVTSEVTTAPDVVMADAETNTEHDSDFERMADLEGSPPPQEGGSGDGGGAGEGVCNSEIDGAQDSCLDPAETSGARQECVYEAKVDEQLESLTSRHDSSQLARDMDDETFSWPSGREAEDAEHEDSLTVHNSQVLTQGHHSALLTKHLTAHQGTPPRTDLDPTALLQELSKPLLSRKPDGASNPHLNQEFSEDEGMAVNEQCVATQYTSVCPDLDLQCKALHGKDTDTQSPGLSTKASCKGAVRCKPPLPQKPVSSSSPSPSFSPKPVGVSKLTTTTTVSSTCSSSGPSAGSSATSTPKSASSKESPLAQKQTSPKGSLLSVGRKEKEKNGKSGKEKDKCVSSPSPTCSGGKGKASSKGGSGCKLPLLGGKSASLSSSSTSPLLPCKEAKLRSKKEKETGKVSRAINGKYVELTPYQHTARAAHDSDSGNDSGIVARDKRLLSPYATVTQPRTPSHSSSGHGSDNSSTISTEVQSQPSSKCDKLHGGTSSGYESMLRESEGTASSDEDDHGDSDSQTSERKKGSKRKGTKRSRSAPARSSESPSSNGGSQGSRVWAEPRHKGKDEPLELKKYDVDDVERLQRRRQEDAECGNGERVQDRGKDVLCKQPLLEEGSKAEVISAKDHISVDERGWGLDCKFLMCFCRSRPAKGTDV